MELIKKKTIVKQNDEPAIEPSVIKEEEEKSNAVVSDASAIVEAEKTFVQATPEMQVDNVGEVEEYAPIENLEEAPKDSIYDEMTEDNFGSDYAFAQNWPDDFAPQDYAEAEKIYRSGKENTAFIEFRNIKKTYKMGETEIKALDGIDFAINKGEFVIVVGASGAGKSTILNIMGGMDKQTSGQIFVDGEEISAYSDKQMILYRRYDVGFVFQFYNLVQNLTAKENVELATQVSKDPLDVDATMEAVGLSNRSKNFPSQLSGGEQQRVAVARALAKNPKLLLCDEPTGALDYNTGKAILKLLQDTARKNGMTVIIITHNYALTSVGDRVIQVKNGRIESITTNKHPMDIEQVEW